jgi:hypothetical protein
MDSERFDAITRTLASGLSRRGVLRTLGGVSAGGVLAVIGRGTVAAKGRPCKNGGIPCGKGNSFACCANNQQCSSDGVCVDVVGACYTNTFAGSCECWTSGNPTTGGSTCGQPNNCVPMSPDNGICAVEGSGPCHCV